MRIADLGAYMQALHLVYEHMKAQESSSRSHERKEVEYLGKSEVINMICEQG